MELGRIRGADTVLAVRFERGASYTGEESVELHCHGGTAAVSRVLDLVIASGARMACPGEFTRRAFINGRIDLAQAEAVLGVIRAAGDDALAASRRAMQGELSAELRRLMDIATQLRAEIEASLDYPDEADASPDIATAADSLAEAVRLVASRCRAGRALREGAQIVLAGAPNAGKSSLLNALAGRDRSIVTDIPGTTRDCVEADIVYRGLPMRLIDTAGIRPDSDATDEVERIGIARARAAVRDADAIVLVADLTAAPDRDELASLLDSARGKRLYVALNKCDRTDASDGTALISLIETQHDLAGAIRTSAITGEGIDELAYAIWRDTVGGGELSESFAVTSRALAELTSAAECAEEAARAYRTTGDQSLASSLLGEAAEHLAAPLGADAAEELLDEIFSKFCLGK